MWLIVLVVAICVVWTIISLKKDNEDATKQQKKDVEVAQQRTIEYKNKINGLKDIVSNGEEIDKQPIVTVVTIGYRENVYYLPHHIWIKDNTLYLFPTILHGTFDNHTGDPRHTWYVSSNEWKLISIPIDRIMFYRQVGSIYSTISGTGGNSSFSPITGFHGKINPIEIKSQVHDERTVQIFYDGGTSDRAIVLEDKDYYILRKLIPKKDYQIVTISESVCKEKNISEFERLKKINEMHKSGLISDTDYEQKKAEILSEI